MAWWLFVIISIASIPLAGAMARERNRSSKTWLWIAIAVGPLAPLALLVLGDKRPAPAI
jgi:ABC-type iron transport system FetAB permease component